MSGRLARPFDRDAPDHLLGRSGVPMPFAPRWNIDPPDPIRAVHAVSTARALILPGCGFLSPHRTRPASITQTLTFSNYTSVCA